MQISIGVYLTFTFCALMQTCAGETKNEDANLSALLMKYLDRIKTKNPQFLNSGEEQDEISDVPVPPVTLAKKEDPLSSNKFPALLTMGPGFSFRSPPHLFNKRTESDGKSQTQACKVHEWFVYNDGMPACVNPVWDGGYDPTFCVKLKNGWVFCNCKGNYTSGMKEGMDTCIKKEKLTDGRCNLTPCPVTFRCVERVALRRYDCVKGRMTVPIWY